jgi:multidrug efflux pump subunit AcrB
LSTLSRRSLNGIAVIKVYFQPHVNIGSAVAQITSISQVQLRSLPPGTTPPFIIQYNASSVPVLQLGLSGQGLSEQQLNDYGQNILRTQLATVEGASIPYPYGGKQRQIQVDLDLHALQSKGLSPIDVVNSISAQNIIAPSGTMKVGNFEYAIETNSAPSVVNDLNNLPIRQVNGAVIYIRDVAHVRDGFPPQTNIVRVDGQRAILMNVLKTGSASTLKIIADIYDKMPAILAQKPSALNSLKVSPLNDQSIFVKGAINGVVREAIVAACLTGHDDPHLSGQLALHHHHRRFHSARHPQLADHPFRAGRDDQHHDPRRPRSSRRHSGRRRHRRNRKHQPEPGVGQRDRAGHS